MQGLFGKMFDFNNNGKIDSGELAAELLFLDKTTNSEEDNDNNDSFTNYVGDDDDGFDDSGFDAD